MTFFKRFFSVLAVPVVCCGIICFSVPSYAATPSTGWDTPVYFDFEPLPVGFFDGDMTATSESLSINFNNLSDRETGSISVPGTVTTITEGSDTFGFWHTDGAWYDENLDSFIIPAPYYNSVGSASADFPTYEFFGDLVASNSSHSETVSSSHDYSGIVTGSIAEQWNTDKRFYSWWVVIGTGYVWFCSDARNSVNAYVTKYSDDQFIFNTSISGGHRAFAVVCGLDGKVSRTVDNGPGSDGSLSSLNFNSTINCKEFRQQSQNNNWGFFQSDNSPGLKGLGALTSGRTFLRTVIFGKESLEFLNWQQLHSDISSLQTAMTSAISGQTNTLVNTNSPGNFDQTSMGNTGSLESLESSMLAPSTDTIFSSDSSSFTSGMGFWRDRMNDLLYFNGSPILPLTVFSLTLGLAAMIIGRRVSGGGSA